MEGPVEIAPGVYGLGSELVNWYLVETDGELTAVDAGVPGFADTLEADLAAIGHKPADVLALVLTHSDSDHTGIALDLRAAGARVLIGAGDEPTLAKPRPKTGDASPIHLLPYLLHPNTYRLLVHFARRGAFKQRKVEGAETYADGDVLDVPGTPRAIHTPGHTVGHCAIHFPSHDALFVGDAFCTLNVITRATGPRLMPRALNVSNQQTADSLARLEPIEAAVVLPGHGRPWHGSPAHAVARVRETL
jgi:glyoxylase-like metal-dependent hydrolase (beta-lactamase superfamily II)